MKGLLFKVDSVFYFDSCNNSVIGSVTQIISSVINVGKAERGEVILPMTVFYSPSQVC
jgi:hypothetical protein